MTYEVMNAKYERVPKYLGGRETPLTSVHDCALQSSPPPPHHHHRSLSFVIIAGPHIRAAKMGTISHCAA